MTDENGKHLGKHKLPSNLVLKKLIFGLGCESKARASLCVCGSFKHTQNLPKLRLLRTVHSRQAPASPHGARDMLG